MSADQGQLRLGQLAVDDVEVGAADAAGADPDEHLPGPGGGIGELAPRPAVARRRRAPSRARPPDRAATRAAAGAEILAAMAKDRRVRLTRDAKLKRLGEGAAVLGLQPGRLARIASTRRRVRRPGGQRADAPGRAGHECFVILARHGAGSSISQVARQSGCWAPATASARWRCFSRAASPIGDRDRGERHGPARARLARVHGADRTSPVVARKVLAAVAERLRDAERAQPRH